MRDENNLDFLRLAAALFVVLGHQYVLFGLNPPAALGSSISTLGVQIFFAISGWLVGRSWDRDPNLLRFALRRGLRILPALVVLTLLTVFVLGPAFTTNPFGSYLTNPRTYEYLQNIAFYINYYLPGVFENNQVKYAVNGSLWSLPSELSMYILVAVVGTVFPARLNVALFWASLLALMSMLKYYLVKIYVGSPIVIYATSLPATVEVGVYFVAGVFLWKCNTFHKPRLDLGIIAIFVLSASATIPPVVDSLLFAYAVLALGLARTPLLKATGRYGDLSYGLYLYAFPMQQASYQLFGTQWGFWFPLFTATAAAACCAYISWHLVERRALQMKPRRRSSANGQTHIARLLSACDCPRIMEIRDGLINGLRRWSRLATHRPPAETGGRSEAGRWASSQVRIAEEPRRESTSAARSTG
jgi:peptidoglycan/LPS O-acetylase OafA/YrhL